MTDLKLVDQDLLRAEAFINGEWRPVRNGEGVFEVTSESDHNPELGIAGMLTSLQIQQHPRSYPPCPISTRTLVTRPSMGLCMPELR